MILIDEMKNLRIYRTGTFLPTLESDKKKGSAILLMTPNYESSKKLMNNPLFINKLRYSSYYINRDISYYIGSSKIEEIDDNESLNEQYQSLLEMSAEERNNLKDSEFGLPKLRKYPLHNEDKVRSAIKFFNYVSKEDENELAKNILKAMKKFNIKDINISNKNRFSKYYNAINEAIKFINDKGDKVPKICPKCNSKVGIFLHGEPVFLCTNKECKKYYGTVPLTLESVTTNSNLNYIDPNGENQEVINDLSKHAGFDKEDNIETSLFLNQLEEGYLNLGDKVILFNEDAKYDGQLRKILYKNRLRKREEVLLLYDQVKKDNPFIKYTYPDIEKYQKRNIFIDLYFYNNIFFQNNNWTLQKGMKLFFEYMTRIIDNPNLSNNGYTKKTLFIPVIDWDKNKDGNLWNFRNSLNPLSLIYYYMMNGMENQLKSTFKDMDLIFVGNGSYFKMNFSQLDSKEVKVNATRFRSFLIKMSKNEEFTADELDTSADNKDSKKVIRTNIVDKIETSKGVDLTKQMYEIDKDKKNNPEEKVSITSKKSSNKKVLSDETDKEDKIISKATLNQPKSDLEKRKENNIKDLARSIDNATEYSNSEDDAMDKLDDIHIRQILMDLESESEDKVNISIGRSERISELDNKLLNSEVKGKSIKDILNEEIKDEDIKMNLNINTPNEEWKELSFVNFDKKYNIDKDVIACFRHFSNTSRPISIRNIDIKDNSTSEDRVELYTVEMEDYKGSRFTVKLDIPIMVDNRFLLRGNSKSIQTQFFNMPIIKTDEDTCQVISNYMKIFLRRFGSGSGKSIPNAGRFIKTANKYTGKDIKFIEGNNSKICSRYTSLPIDYIDLAGSFSKIETKDFIIYFNQDEIRELYEIDESKGVPYFYNKENKNIEYIPRAEVFVDVLVSTLDSYGYKNFIELFNSMNPPKSCTYSRASIMNSQIPLIIICAYHEGLRKTLDKGGIKYWLKSTLSKEDRNNSRLDWIKFNDGYVVYESNYESSLLMNGLKTCYTEGFSISNIDNKNMYLEFLDNFGGRIKADGLENFYDCMIDPMTRESLEFYKFPTDYISILLYANKMLADNSFIKHTDTRSRRFRRYQLIAVYTYKVLADAYGSYANQLKHASKAEFMVKQSAVIDKFLTDTITSDDTCINALRDIETTNSVTTKGPSGMNSDRAYSLDKRTYDDSMLNVLGMSTGFASNVGITRQATIDANVDSKGYVKSIKGDTSKMNTTKSLTITEALIPMVTTHDDPIRTAMSFIQTSKHAVRTEDSDPLLVTNGADEAMPYLSTNKFAYKAKGTGKIIELEEDHILIEYKDGTKDYINLKETIEKNSDGGYFVPLKLDPVNKLKVGSMVYENMVVAYDKYSFSDSLGESNNLAYNVGKLAKVAIINSDEGFEDSGIISNSMAKKLATRINLQFSIILEKDTNLFSYAKIGDHVEAGDDLMVWQAPYDDEDANTLLKTLSKDEVSELGKRKLKSEVTGVVTAMKVFRTLEIDELSDSLKKFVNDYEKPLIALEKKYRENNLDISEIPAHYVLPATGKLKKAQDAVLVEFYVEYLDTVGVGDKIVYNAANKAVIKNVIPEGKEAYTEFRPNEAVDAFISEVSIDKRMVTSIVIYGSLQKLMAELDRSVKDILNIPYDDSKI